MIVNMTKRICAALAATVALCTPAFARVDPGTVELIRTAEQYGATFATTLPVVVVLPRVLQTL